MREEVGKRVAPASQNKDRGRNLVMFSYKLIHRSQTTMYLPVFGRCRRIALLLHPYILVNYLNNKSFALGTNLANIYSHTFVGM